MGMKESGDDESVELEFYKGNDDDDDVLCWVNVIVKYSIMGTINSPWWKYAMGLVGLIG